LKFKRVVQGGITVR